LAILAQLLQLQVEGGIFVSWVVGVAFAAQENVHFSTRLLAAQEK
jgi:hypothetical protein